MKQLPEKQGVQTHINWTAFVQKRWDFRMLMMNFLLLTALMHTF
jgi:hypothetical protein